MKKTKKEIIAVILCSIGIIYILYCFADINLNNNPFGSQEYSPINIFKIFC